MFCPGCGQQPASDRIRYCTHCGFALKQLTDFLSNEAPPTTTRQFDITLGAGLMLVGTLKMALFALTTGDTIWGEAWAVGLLLLGLFYGVLQLFFLLSPRQRGLSLGATLMFLSSLAVLPVTAVFHGLGAILVGVVAIPLILFWSRLAQAFYKLFFEKKEPAVESHRLPTQPPAILEPVKSVTQAEVETQRMKPVGVASALSITENTTGLLEK
jgi:hypothetical protein